jgi:hypothetical protein
MAEITFQGDDGPSVSLSAAESALLDEISIKPQTKTVPIVRPKPARPKPVFDPGLDNFINTSKRLDEDRHVRFQQPQPSIANEDDEQQFMEEDVEEQQRMHDQSPPSEGYKSIEDEKADLLNKIARLQKKGFSPGRKFTIHSDVEELRTEYKRITYGIEADQSIKFQRRMLLACVTGIEFLNKRYDPFDVQLDGWSENMMEGIDDYDGVFEELYAKYRDKVNVAPEIKLIMMVGGSAMMFHLTNSIFKNAMPNMKDVMKKNPDLMKNMIDALNTTSGPPSGSQREMKGPGIDIGSLMGGFGFPAMPQQTRTKPPVIQEEETMSDIVSVLSSDGDGTKDITIGSSGSRRRSKKKNEVTL